MAKLSDLLATNPEAKAEHDQMIKAQADAAAAAVDAEKNKKPVAASLAELKGIVPASMAGRSDMIVELQEKGATVAQAYAAVTAKLAEQNAELAKNAGAKETVAASLGGNGIGGPALALPGQGAAGGKPGNETYMGLVEAEQERLIAKGVPEKKARADAFAKISGSRRDLLEAHNQTLREAARAAEPKKRLKAAV